ncbi:MAG TPA: serine/threonine protein kinase, partial [Candidatus Paceibacterota bacterium]|nr:serine/threonine protein kinase [Candidatus Paceibacterota bacterium]
MNPQDPSPPSDHASGPEPGPELAPGSKLGRGRFRVIQSLGRGGMGMVWLALDTALNERAAIKLLP